MDVDLLPVLSYGGAAAAAAGGEIKAGDNGTREEQPAAATTILSSGSDRRATAAATSRKPSPSPKKRPTLAAAAVDPAAARRSAAFRVVERLLEEEEELTADAVRALCSPLSGEELLHAADERTLAGKCGWAACCFSSEGFELLDPARSRRIASRGPRRRLPALAGMQGRDERFCGAECELACLRLASRLGAEADALRRFEEKRSASSSSSSGASTEGAAAVAPVPRQLQQQQKTKREFAAGTAESPIMRSVVVERKKAAARGGVAAVAAPSSSPPLLSDPIAVDGYVPRGAAGVVRAAAAADAVANNMSQSPLSSSPGGGGGCSTPRGSLRRTVSWSEEADEARSLSRLGSSVVRRRVEAEDLSRARAIAAGDDGSSNSSDDERLPTTTTDGEKNSNDAPRPSVPGVTAGIPIISFEMEEEEEEENEGQRHGGGGEEVARFGRLKISAAGEGADAAAAAFPSATSRDGAAAAPNDLSLSSSDSEDNGNDGDLSPRSAAAAVAAALPLPLPELIARAQQRRRNNGGGGDSGSSSIPASALLDEARERQLVADFVTWRARLDADDDEGAEAVTPMVMADAAPPSLTAAAPSSPRQQQQQRPFEPASPGTPDRSGGGPLAVGVALAPRGGTPCSSDDEGEEGEGGNGVLIDVDDNEEEDNVAGTAAWLSAPPPGSTRLAPPLSPFGVLLAALDSLVTPETRAMLSSSDSSSSAASFAAATSAAALPLPKTISAPLSRALPLLVAEMRLALPASTVEALLAEVARSFDLSGAAWNDGEEGNSDEGKSKNSSPLSDPQWQVILLVLLKALSLERVPALRPAFEERQGITRLSASLRRLGCTLEAFGALLDIAVVADD